jgi:putative FmdB family regulatory protein
MPTYDYECSACGHAFEHFQSMSSKPLRKCPACGRPRLKRLIGTGAGVIFKGSGFYETDYKRSGAGAKSASESGSKAGSDADSDSSAGGKDKSKAAAADGA